MNSRFLQGIARQTRLGPQSASLLTHLALYSAVSKDFFRSSAEVCDCVLYSSSSFAYSSGDLQWVIDVMMWGRTTRSAYSITQYNRSAHRTFFAPRFKLSAAASGLTGASSSRYGDSAKLRAIIIGRARIVDWIATRRIARDCMIVSRSGRFL